MTGNRQERVSNTALMSSLDGESLESGGQTSKVMVEVRSCPSTIIVTLVGIGRNLKAGLDELALIDIKHPLSDWVFAITSSNEFWIDASMMSFEKEMSVPDARMSKGSICIETKREKWLLSYHDKSHPRLLSDWESEDSEIVSDDSNLLSRISRRAALLMPCRS